MRFCCSEGFGCSIKFVFFACCGAGTDGAGAAEADLKILEPQNKLVKAWRRCLVEPLVFLTRSRAASCSPEVTRLCEYLVGEACRGRGCLEAAEVGHVGLGRVCL